MQRERIATSEEKSEMRLLERKTFKPCLPSVIMGNVRSLGNKMDEHTALTQSYQEYR